MLNIYYYSLIWAHFQANYALFTFNTLIFKLIMLIQTYKSFNIQRDLRTKFMHQGNFPRGSYLNLADPIKKRPCQSNTTGKYGPSRALFCSRKRQIARLYEQI